MEEIFNWHDIYNAFVEEEYGRARNIIDLEENWDLPNNNAPREDSGRSELAGERVVLLPPAKDPQVIIFLTVINV